MPRTAVAPPAVPPAVPSPSVPPAPAVPPLLCRLLPCRLLPYRLLPYRLLPNRLLQCRLVPCFHLLPCLPCRLILRRRFLCPRRCSCVTAAVNRTNCTASRRRDQQREPRVRGVWQQRHRMLIGPTGHTSKMQSNDGLPGALPEKRLYLPRSVPSLAGIPRLQMLVEDPPGRAPPKSPMPVRHNFGG